MVNLPKYHIKPLQFKSTKYEDGEFVQMKSVVKISNLIELHIVITKEEEKNYSVEFLNLSKSNIFALAENYTYYKRCHFTTYQDADVYANKIYSDAMQETLNQLAEFSEYVKEVH